MPSKPRNKKPPLAPSSLQAPPAARPPAAPLRAGLPADYVAVLEDIRTRIRTAPVRAALSVNRELIRLYWEIGGLIVRRQSVEGWGKSVIERLALDIQASFPGMRGFSSRNLWKMRSFYLAWTTDSEVEPPRGKKTLEAILPQAAAELPWEHNMLIIGKLHDRVRRLWYAQQTVAHGWSRSMLRHWIESDLYSRRAAAVTNFEATLPAPQSDLARQIVRDPYSFDFLTLRTDAAERDLERGLLANIRRSLLELGTGFAFVGQQVRLEVDGEDYCLDLLFYLASAGT